MRDQQQLTDRGRNEQETVDQETVSESNAIAHEQATPCQCTGHRRLGRRQFIGGMGVAGTIAVAGCLGDDEADEEIPDPIDLSGNKQCDVCGMIIEAHYGPNGQVYFDEPHPPGRDGPAWYDSVRELYFDMTGLEGDGLEPMVVYVTDYAAVEYTVETVSGTDRISSHVAADGFIDAEAASFVIESTVEGAMGSDLLPFSDRAVAEAFLNDHGGRVVTSADLTREAIEDL